MGGWPDFQAKYMDIANVSPYIAGVKKPGRTIQRTAYYVYETSIAAITTGATGTSTIETQADSDFVLDYISGGTRVGATGNTLFSSNVLLQIVDTSSGKPFFNVPTLLPLVAGGGGFPFLLGAPRVINPNTSLVVTATNRMTNTVAFLDLAFHGTRIFYAD